MSHTKTTYSSVFGFSLAYHMFCKLENERERVHQAQKIQAHIEHSINFAFTAYHLVEWVCRVTELEPEQEDGDANFEKQGWLREIGFTPNHRYEIHEWATGKCPSLEYCRQISNASKHLSCYINHNHENVAFDVSPTPEWEHRRDENPFIQLLEKDQARNWRLTVQSDQGEKDLIYIFDNEVFPFWEKRMRAIYLNGF